MLDTKTAIEQLVACGLKIDAKGFVIGTGGNTSVRTDDAIYIKASGESFAAADASSYIPLDPESGEPIDPARRPSVERPMHLACYRAREDIEAVIHCHPAMAIAWAMTGEDLGALTPDSAAHLGERVPVLPYHPPSSDKLAKLIGQKIAGGAGAVILANHGVVAAGGSLEEAFRRVCLVEETAQIAVFGRLLHPEMRFFTPEQVKAVRQRAYGMMKKGQS